MSDPRQYEIHSDRNGFFIVDQDGYEASWSRTYYFSQREVEAELARWAFEDAEDALQELLDRTE